MGYDLVSVIELCGIAGIAFWLLGFCMILIGVRMGRREFRSKGFLRPPSGIRWFRFLLWKHYDAFDNPTTRLFFGYAHFCLIVMIIIATAIVVLLGSELLLNGVSGFPDGGFTKPTL